MEISEEELSNIRETSWIQGQRAALVNQLTQALEGLMYDKQFTLERLIKEREEVIAALRSICEDHGDNDWDHNLHLADVINKHLGDYLYD